MLGGLISMVIALTRQSTSTLPAVILSGAVLLCIGGNLFLIPFMIVEERKLQQRLDACSAAGTSGGMSSWPLAPAILVRLMPQKRSAAFRTALYAANTPQRSVLPVAVRLGQGNQPAVSSGAWLRLDPDDPAVALIDPNATPENHANAAIDPALTGLSRTERGLAVPGKYWLWPLLAGAAATVLIAIAASAMTN